MTTHVGQEVSCRPIEFFFQELDKAGIPSDLLRDGIDLPRERLTDPRARIDWETFRQLMSNVRRVWSGEELVAAGRRLTVSPWMQPWAAIARLLLDCRGIYRWTMEARSGVSAQHFTCIVNRLSEPRPGRLEVETRMADGYAPSPELYRIFEGSLSAIPRLLGLPEAKVERVDEGDRVRYLIAYPMHSSLLAGLRRRLALPGAVRSAARELRDLQEELFLRADPEQWAAEVRARTDAALRESESRFYKAFHASPMLLAISTLDSRLLNVNDTFVQASGYSRDELVGRKLSEFEMWNDPEQRRRTLDALRDGRPVRGRETEFRERTGILLTTILSGEPISVEGERCIFWQAIDITDRKRAEEELRASERRYRGLFETSQEAIIVLDAEGRPGDINPAGLELFEFASKEEYLRSDPAADLYQDPGDRARLLERLRREGSVQDYELALKTLSGRPITALLNASLIRDGSGAPAGFRGLVRDVSEQRRLESELRHSQRLEAIGQLAGGVAHDFNNLLTAISSYAEILLDAMEVDDPRREEVGEILAAGERGAALTRQMLAFGRRQVLRPRLLDVNDVVTGVLRLLRRTLGEDITVRTELAAELGWARADPGQLEQVLVNLAVNARDAMPEGGEIVFETADVELDAAATARLAGLDPGRYVRLAVTDSGRGMDEATRGRVFEPFFTTKQMGSGTGLGLSTVYGIVKQSGGHIRVESRPGSGSRFEIHLPRVERAARGRGRRARAAASTAGCETLLLVEDDAGIRDLTARALRGKGYSVLTATDGREAVEVLRSASPPVDLVVTDLVMPRMAGGELARRIAALAPGTRILVVSGYSPERLPADPSRGGGLPFLAKPYTPRSLARKVREVLDGG